jgi:hypothetical protein
MNMACDRFLPGTVSIVPQAFSASGEGASVRNSGKNAFSR